MRTLSSILVIFFMLIKCSSFAQTSNDLTDNVEKVSSKLLVKVNERYTSATQHINKKTIKYVEKLRDQEKKLLIKEGNKEKEIGKIDSLYGNLISDLKANKTKSTSQLNEYNGYLDTLSTSLTFLSKQKGISEKVKIPLESLNRLKAEINQSQQIEEFIANRKSEIKERFTKYLQIPSSLKKQYENLSKTSYYYSAQMREYKEMVKDPKKMERKAIDLLNELPAFQKFLKENSQLASLFRVTGSEVGNQDISGLQTRASVQTLVQNRIASGGPNALAQVQQNLAAAKSEIDNFKNKIGNLNGGSADVDFPDFKPNDQKTKTFLKRLEYGFDVQFAKNNSYFPSSADMALSAGYKLNDKSLIGIGGSYKMGMGSIEHISITHQGLGLRSFIDWKAPFSHSKSKLLKSLWITGGYEMNYNAAFKNIEQLKGYDCWQRSALIGVSKKYQVSKKVKGEMKILYDFLAGQHVPLNQAVVFRVGYKF